MNYIIVDLEATCLENRDNSPNEIIEIGAVCINEKQDIIGEFNRFVRPSIHPILSDFCINLTSISQEQVNNSNTFPLVLAEFKEWINSFLDDYLLCSWGFYDQVQLKNDCQLHGLDIDWLYNHISLKHQYAIIKKTRSMGMKNALKNEKLILEGTHHRGIDDAKNIAKIFCKLFNKWNFSKRRE
ncbi:3'-5' exonuclease [Emticicia aquatilis]|nr:3'-5' exonuclease [Emticicia aquatilis]